MDSEGWDFKSLIKGRLKWGLKPVSDGLFVLLKINFKNVIDYVKISRIIQLIRKHKASLNNLKG